MKKKAYLGNPKTQPVGQVARQYREQQVGAKSPKKAK